MAGSRCCLLYQILAAAADGTRITVTASTGNHASTYTAGSPGMGCSGSRSVIGPHPKKHAHPPIWTVTNPFRLRI